MTRATTNDSSEAGTDGALAGWLDRHRSDVAWLAVVGLVHAREALDERRLAGAVVADEPQDLAREELQVDALEGVHGAVGLRDGAGFEHG